MVRRFETVVLALVGVQECFASRVGARSDGFLVDTEGRVRIFRGFNDIQGKAKGRGPYTGDNYIPKYLIHEDMLQQLEEMGFNGFRIPMMWAAVQPTSDLVPDEKYLSRMMNITQALERHNMYGLLDMHKDTVAFDGAYDGYPRWLTNRTQPKHPYPWPLKEVKSWGDAYLTEQVAQSVQEVYDNTHGGMDAWKEFWRTVARRFKDRENVLGYELINEPWAGNEFEDPLLMLPGYAGKHNLEPSYESLAGAIREIDNETLLFFEPTVYGMIFSGSVIDVAGSGFDKAPDEKSVFTWHYYCWFADGQGDDHYSTLVKTACDKALGPQVFNAVVRDRAHLRVPSFMSEWGGKTPNASKPDSAAVIELEAVMDLADKNFESWTFYDMVSITDGDGELITDAMKVFARPFAQAIAGTPSAMSFVSSSDTFTLEYEADPALGAPTEIVVPALRFPDGFSIELSDGLTWEMAKGRVNVVAVSTTKSASAPKHAATVVITPKPASGLAPLLV